ncbi:MAG: MBL fold metallo-hydrolase [Williamsia sp.]|nr:MBL fold metallo-hydrolase [Williamsia sp.]
MLTVQSFVFSPLQENTYLLYNEEKAACVIDPGCYLENEQLKLQNVIEGQGLLPNFLLNTHCHLDHVFGNQWFYEKYGKPLHIHPQEERVLQLAPEFGKLWGMPFENYKGPLLFLQEGDTVKIGEDILRVLFTPGHAPGHICFYCEAQGFVISGDTLFRGSIGRTDLPLGNYNTLIHSIRTRLLILPDDTIIYPGHGGATTVGEEKRSNPFLSEP